MKRSNGWLDRQLKKPSFRKKFVEESWRLSIAEQLTKIRLAAGLTQAELAKKVGTTASAISRYENTDYNRYEVATIRKIAEACGGKLRISITH